MLRILVMAFVLSNLVYAQIPVNNTILANCTAGLTNCTKYNVSCDNWINDTDNCNMVYNACVQEARVNLRAPQSCYLAHAAKTGLIWTFGFTVFIFGLTIVIMPILAGLGPFVANKIPCCRDKGLDQVLVPIPPNPPGEAKPLDPITEPGKVIINRMVLALGAMFGTVVNFATITSLYTSWSAWTTADANCAYDTYLPLKNVGDLHNDDG